jgi:hypothetical protein
VALRDVPRRPTLPGYKPFFFVLSPQRNLSKAVFHHLGFKIDWAYYRERERERETGNGIGNRESGTGNKDRRGCIPNFSARA